MVHSKDQVDQFLRDAFFAVLTFLGTEGLVSQLMIFGHTVEGDLYLASQYDKEVFDPLASHPEVSILIYKEEEKLEDICQTNIIGQASLIEGVDNDEAKLAFEAIGEKSPAIGNVSYDQDSRYTLVKVEAKTITYITFGELKENKAPTILKRA
ncbi:MAG: hypothetical protein IEMM0008_1009 [bacterium]|nr:MAG: hypothetical protein IEMM0008_1009 [bacterium]